MSSTTSLLSQAKKGKIRLPVLAIIYGPDGVGKSTLGSEAPNPIFLGTEKGTANLDVFRYPKELNSFQDVMDAIEDLRANPHSFETLVIDSLDWLEPLVWEHVVHVSSPASGVQGIEDYGYGKGYVYAIEQWRKMVSLLGRLRSERKMNVILIAHTQVKIAKDPQAASEYDRYQLKLNDKAAALWREFVDGVYFVNFETVTATDKKGKTRAFGEGDRYLYTERRPAFDAKNRFGLPFQIPLVLGDSWNALKSAIDSSNPEDPTAVIRLIENELSSSQDEVLKTAVRNAVEKAGTELSKLERILGKVRTAVKAA